MERDYKQILMADSVAQKKKHKHNKNYWREAFSGYSLIAPFMLLLLIFSFYTFAYGFYQSFRSSQGLNPGDFIGLANYKEVLTSTAFWKAVKNTFVFTAGCLVTQIPVAFVLAVILNSLPLKRVQSALRAAFFLPVLINTVVIALLFRMLFNPDQGIVNWVLELLHLPNTYNFLMDSRLTMPLLIIVSFWQWTGFHMVYFVSQLQTIDPTLYESAKIDGAGRVKTLLRITVPMMRPALTFVVVTSAIGGLQLFDLVFMLFPNASYGPGGAGMTMIAHIYDQGFSSQFRLGYAAAVGWVVFFIIFIFSLIQLKAFGFGSNDE